MGGGELGYFGGVGVDVVEVEVVRDRWMKPGGYTPPQNAQELLERYQRGERYFAGVALEGANLKDADLKGANLFDANLEDTDLEGANLTNADLYDANLTNVSLHNANLSSATLINTDLTSAFLYNADLRYANLINVSLYSADLRHANLTNVDLAYADLTSADLEDTYLERANLTSANFTGANVAGIFLGGTNLTNINLEPFCTHPIEHHGPSTIDWRSVARSLKVPNLSRFLVDAGMPKDVALYLIDSVSQLNLAVVLQSVFLSYGTPDKVFTKRLQGALNDAGVQTWLFDDDAIPGRRLHAVLSRHINQYDRVVLVCSRDSIMRSGVRHEIEEVFDRERREGGSSILIPVNLDGYIFEENTKLARDSPEVRRGILSRVVADFSNHEDPESFNIGVQKLLRALQKPRNEK